MAPWLSFWIARESGKLMFRSSRMIRSHANSFPASTVALYSASVEERLTVGCFLDIQLTAPPCKVNTYPVVERLVAGSPAQSASA